MTATDDRADKGLPWGRLYADWFQDYKVQSMSDSMQRRHIVLMCLHIKGLTDPSDEEVIYHMRVTPEEWAETRRIFIEKGFMREGSNHLIAWERRQYKTDVSTERVRKHRLERMKRPETVSETAPDTDTETEAETEADTHTTELSEGERVGEAAGLVSESLVDQEPGDEWSPPSRSQSRVQARLLKRIGQAYGRLLPKWPQVACYSTGMRMSLNLNISAHPERADPEFWEGLFERAAASDWLNGPQFGSRSLAWLLKPETADKLVNGMFQGRGGGTSGGGGPSGNWAFLQTLNRQARSLEVAHE